jgi:hypothetical protein
MTALRPDMLDVANLFQSCIKQWIIACPMQWNGFFFLSRVATLPCSAGGHYRTLAGASYYFLSSSPPPPLLRVWHFIKILLFTFVNTLLPAAACVWIWYSWGWGVGRSGLSSHSPFDAQEYAITFVVTAMQCRGLWCSSALYVSSVSYSLAHVSLHYGDRKTKGLSHTFGVHCIDHIY